MFLQLKHRVAKLFSALVVLTLGFAPMAAQAQFELFKGETAGRNDYRVYVQQFYAFSIGAGILIATVLIMVGGIMWVTSAGNPSRIDKAKDYITDSIIGVVLLIAAYTILNVINPNLVNLKLPEFPKFSTTLGTCLYVVNTATVQGKRCVESTQPQCEASYGKTAEFTENQTCSVLCAEIDTLGFCRFDVSERVKETIRQNEQLRQQNNANAKSDAQIACEIQGNFGNGELIPEARGFATDSGTCATYCRGAGPNCQYLKDVDNDEGVRGDLIRCWCQYTGSDKK